MGRIRHSAGGSLISAPEYRRWGLAGVKGEINRLSLKGH